MFHILIVEDNNDLLHLFNDVLTAEGYECFLAKDGKEALSVFDSQFIDLLITDVMMPGLNGYELTKSLRDANYSVPILMVTAKDDYGSLKEGFDAGTDDFMVKPINPSELAIRVRALLRRAKIVNDKKIVLGKTVLDYNALSVTTENESFTLPQKEFYLLYKLLSYPNKIFTRQELMDEIWGMESETDDRTINTHINRLRERFDTCPDFEIMTVRGLGYKAVKR